LAIVAIPVPSLLSLLHFPRLRALPCRDDAHQLERPDSRLMLAPLQLIDHVAGHPEKPASLDGGQAALFSPLCKFIHGASLLLML
jgi:hypothetical protein